MGALLLTTLQITLAGYQSAESTWFTILTTVMAEEENEDTSHDSETKVKKKFASAQNLFLVLTCNKYFQSLEAQQFYLSEFKEVFSPPPEA